MIAFGILENGCTLTPLAGTEGAVYTTGGAVHGASFPSIAVGDLDGDGQLDIVTTHGCQNSPPNQKTNMCSLGGEVAVLLGTGDGQFVHGSSFILADLVPYSASLADVDGDGKLDLVSATLHGVAVLKGNGDGSFQPSTDYAGVPITPETFGFGIAVADINGDGVPDIIQPSTFDARMAIFLNRRVSTVTTISSYANPTTYGQTVTFTATVTSNGGLPTGTVTFLDGTTQLGTGTLSSCHHCQFESQSLECRSNSDVPGESHMVSVLWRDANGNR